MADFKEIQIDGQVYQVKDETARENAGGYAPPAGGIPKTDLASDVQTSLGKADTSLQQSDKAELQSAIGNKVDKVAGKGLSTEDYTAAEKAKLAGLPTGSELGNTYPTKTQMQSAIAEAVENLPTGADGITPHIGQNGNWWVGAENDSTNDTGVKAQGPAGDSITDADLIISNNFSGDGDVLGIEGAMMVKNNINSLYSSLLRLYNRLCNAAFWTAADKTAALPTAISWSLPPRTITITNSIGNGAAIKLNGNVVGGTIYVEVGSNITLTIEGVGENGLTNVAATVDGVQATLSEENGIYSLTVLNVTSDIAIVVTGTATQRHTVTVNTTLCTASYASNKVTDGDDFTCQLVAYAGCVLPSTVSYGNGLTTNVVNGTFVIPNVTSDITVVAVAEEVLKMGVYIDMYGNESVKDGYCATNFIPVSVGECIYYERGKIVGTTNGRGAFYDSDKQFLSETSAKDQSVILIPANAAFIRMTFNVNELDDIASFACMVTDVNNFTVTNKRYLWKGKDYVEGKPLKFLEANTVDGVFCGAIPAAKITRVSNSTATSLSVSGGSNAAASFVTSQLIPVIQGHKLYVYLGTGGQIAILSDPKTLIMGGDWRSNAHNMSTPSNVYGIGATEEASFDVPKDNDEEYGGGVFNASYIRINVAPWINSGGIIGNIHNTYVYDADAGEYLWRGANNPYASVDPNKPSE